ncbi:MAG: OmpA family protein [Phycisphaeraceae bacterium]|nr:OmpA family protein [Phycisphaeraceae bacterium]
MADEKKKGEHGDEHGEGGHKKKKHKSHGHGGGHKGHHEEGAPEWLISFADNVTLMMGFFVIMLAMNMNPPDSGAKSEGPASGGAAGTPHPGFLDAAIAIRQGFNNPVSMSSSDPNDQALIQRIKKRQQDSGTGRRTGVQGNEDEVQMIRPNDYYTVGGVVPFNQGSTSLTLATRQATRTIANNLQGRNFIIEIRGHASAIEARRDAKTAYDISYRRAVAVAEALNANGIPWARMRIVGAGDFDRNTAIAYDAAAHLTNQRVEIMVTREVLPQDPHLDEPATLPERTEPVTLTTDDEPIG